jgi:putative ABC transport system permease protein
VEDVQAVLAATANPENPNEVQVSRPSDALAAKQATDKTFTGLLLGWARWRCSSAASGWPTRW